jgi:hypothetical protein
MVEPNSHRSQVADGGDRYLLQWFIGYGTRYATTAVTVCLVLPLALFTSLFCRVYIDSQNGGFIGVCPQNLIALASSLAAHSLGGTKPAYGFLAGVKPGSRAESSRHDAARR